MTPRNGGPSVTSAGHRPADTVIDLMDERAAARILFVDDDAVNRRTLGWIFRDAGFDVQEAGTGREALQLVQGRPDLVGLDIGLPDISGFDVCRRIKEDPA